MDNKEDIKNKLIMYLYQLEKFADRDVRRTQIKLQTLKMKHKLIYETVTSELKKKGLYKGLLST